MKRAGLRIVCLLCGLLVLAAGCDRHIPSRNPLRSLPADPPTPVNLTAQVNDRSVTLSWEVSDSSNVGKFRIYRAVGASGQFTLIDSSSG
jgi:hypothetical protein